MIEPTKQLPFLPQFYFSSTVQTSLKAIEGYTTEIFFEDIDEMIENRKATNLEYNYFSPLSDRC